MLMTVFGSTRLNQTIMLLIAGLAAMTGFSANNPPQTAVQAQITASKIHPLLKAEMDLLKKNDPDNAHTQRLKVVAHIKAGSDAHRYMHKSIVRPYVDPLGNQTVYGEIEMSLIPKLALRAEVQAIQPMKPLAQPITMDAPPEQVDLKSKNDDQAPPQNKGWWDVGPGHHSRAAWEKGYTGQGVIAMINDSGIDFAHPDLMNTWAVVTDPNSPFHGWPMMFDSYSMTMLAIGEFFFGYDAVAAGETDYADTSATCPEGEPCFYQAIGSEKANAYKLTGTSKSGVYHIGSHPDRGLADRVFGNRNLLDDGEERPGILVVDENEPGVYDTVYVDLNGNYDFSDDKPVNKQSPVSYLDNWNAAASAPGSDGYADVSGGLVYYIADGIYSPPLMTLFWGPFSRIRENGSLVAFVVQDFTEPAEEHGQLAASALVGQGVINGNAPAWKPEGDGTPFTGMVQAAGRDVKLTTGGNLFLAFDFTDIFAFAALGYDGLPQTGDEVQISSNSWGANSPTLGYQYGSYIIDAIVKELNPKLSILNSSNNNGPGYGTTGYPDGYYITKIGASTQFGSTDRYGQIGSVDQIQMGDVASFSGRSPALRGIAGVYVTANGSWGAGSLPLNAVGDGWTSWTNWGGTSRSCPVAAGNLALVYQAYKETYGEWPDAVVAREILAAGADDQHQDPASQGAGKVNADRATDIASGRDGVVTSPAQWLAGSYRGVDYEAFNKIMIAGESDEQRFTITNPTERTMNVSLVSDQLLLSGRHDLIFSSETVNREPQTGFARYLTEITEHVPADVDLMEIRASFPWGQWDPEDRLTIQNEWQVILLDWTDLDGDGQLWEDRNNNGIADLDEMDPNEYNYIVRDYNRNNSFHIRARQPRDRMHDGLFLMFVHNSRDNAIPVTDFQAELRYYKHQPWSWLTLDKTAFSIQPGQSETVAARLTVPAKTPLGYYQGAIHLNVWGPEQNSAVNTSVIPVTAHVAANGPNFAFGGNTPSRGLFDNGRMTGNFDWAVGSSGLSDWRTFYFDIPNAAMSNQALVIDTRWQNLDSDINIIMMEPRPSCFTDPRQVCDSGLSLASDPDFFGPSIMDPVFLSEQSQVGAIPAPWHTSTSGAGELVVLPLGQPGLHALMLQHVKHAGTGIYEPFAGRVGTIRAPRFGLNISADELDGEHAFDITSTNLVNDLQVTAFGMADVKQFENQVAQADDPADPLGASYRQSITIKDSGLLEAVITIHDGPAVFTDLDLLLIDPNGRIAAITQNLSNSSQETVSVNLPIDGEWTVAVHGIDVPESGQGFDLEIAVYEDKDLKILDFSEARSTDDGNVQTVKFGYSLPSSEQRTWNGVIFVGTARRTDLMQIPVRISKTAVQAQPLPDGNLRLLVKVFEDQNCNGLKEADEPWLGSQAVRLTFSDSGLEVTENTNANGQAGFGGFGIPKRLTVSVHSPFRSHVPCPDRPTTVELKAGDFGVLNLKTLEFGITPRQE